MTKEFDLSVKFYVTDERGKLPDGEWYLVGHSTDGDEVFAQLDKPAVQHSTGQTK